MRCTRHCPSGFTTSHGDHLAPGHKKPLHQGSLAPCKSNAAPRPRLSLEKRWQPRATRRPRRTPRTALLRSFYPIFTPFYPNGVGFTPFLPPFYPNGAVFTPFLPPFYPSGAGFTPFLPQFYPPHHLTFTRFYPIFYPANYPVFTPFLPFFEG